MDGNHWFKTHLFISICFEKFVNLTFFHIYSISFFKLLITESVLIFELCLLMQIRFNILDEIVSTLILLQFVKLKKHLIPKHCHDRLHEGQDYCGEAQSWVRVVSKSITSYKLTLVDFY